MIRNHKGIRNVLSEVEEREKDATYVGYIGSKTPKSAMNERKNSYKRVVEAWNSGSYKTARELAKEMKLSDATVASHLRKGTAEGLCNYGGMKLVNITRMRPVVQLDLSGNVIKVWDSGKGASDGTSVNKQSIMFCCKGKQKTAGGFKWEYKDEYDKRLK